MMDRRTHEGPSCMTVMTVRDPSPKGLHFLSQVSYDGHLQRTVVTVTVRPAHTVMLVRDPLSEYSIYTEFKYTTTDHRRVCCTSPSTPVLPDTCDG